MKKKSESYIARFKSFNEVLDVVNNRRREYPYIVAGLYDNHDRFITFANNYETHKLSMNDPSPLRVLIIARPGFCNHFMANLALLLAAHDTEKTGIIMNFMPHS